MIIYLCLAMDMIRHRREASAPCKPVRARMASGEYEANPLPSDSDYKQQIYKEEARASRKVKADKLRISKVRAWWYPRRSTVSSQFQPRTPIERPV